MNNALTHSLLSVRMSDKLIFATIIGSLLVHLLAVIVIPNITFEKEQKPDPIIIELVKPPEPEVIQPEPVKETPKPKPKPVVKKIKKDKPKPVKKIEPKPIPKETMQEPIDVPEIVPPEPQEPPVIAVAPTHEVPPSPVPPAPIEAPPPPPPPPGPTQSELDAAKNAYGNSLRNAMIRHKKYPTVAKRRGWQGDVVLEFTIDGNGNILSKKIIESSSYEALDNQAMSMAEKAAPFPKPPATLAGQSFVIKVRIPFKLREQ